MFPSMKKLYICSIIYTHDYWHNRESQKLLSRFYFVLDVNTVFFARFEASHMIRSFGVNPFHQFDSFSFLQFIVNSSLVLETNRRNQLYDKIRIELRCMMCTKVHNCKNHTRYIGHVLNDRRSGRSMYLHFHDHEQTGTKHNIIR